MPMDRKKKRANQFPKPPGSRAHLGDYILEDVHDYRINRHSFTIYVGGDPRVDPHDSPDEPGVEWTMADRFENNLSILSGINPRRPILIQMSSCGGDWEAGMQMFSAILTCPNPTTVLGVKWCRSMTSIIPLAADKFILRPPSKYMYHRGTFVFEGTDQEAETEDLERRRRHEIMLRIYTARVKSQGEFKELSERKIRTMLDNNIKNKIDVWLSPDEAVAWGFADGLLVSPTQLKNLKIREINKVRRDSMMEILRKPLEVEIKVK